jgi:hypothetical protein
MRSPSSKAGASRPAGIARASGFALTHAAKHVGEIDHLEEAHAPVS